MTEALAAGIPVIGARYGALGERIRANGCGWTIDPMDPDGIRVLIERLDRGARRARARARARCCASRSRPSRRPRTATPALYRTRSAYVSYFVTRSRGFLHELRAAADRAVLLDHVAGAVDAARAEPGGAPRR